MPVRCEVARNDPGRHHPARYRQTAANEPYANVYDVFGFVLQLLQMTPIVSACLVSLVANPWLVRSLTMLFLVVSCLVTRHLAARHRRGQAGRQADEAGRRAQSLGPALLKVRVVHRRRVLPGKYIAHCLCRPLAGPRRPAAGVR